MLTSKLRVAVLAVSALLVLPVHGQNGTELPSPEQFLGYELGAQFTPHHRIVEYVRAVAAHSPVVDVREYGSSVEGRPLLLATITAPENHERLSTIRRSNLQRTGFVNGTPETDEAIVWLSYNVHGDEPVSSEAAMRTLYSLADPTNERARAWLEDTVVLLDPCLNPDGRARYVHWYREIVGASANVNPSAREHHPPWAPGRTNHYYFDLNRDWAWGVQSETQQRLNAYHRWMPQVHVDFHEMGVDDPYYFAPGAEPYHEDLTEWQREFQHAIGRNNASYFDRNGWLYFTQEVFDLFYPGYGDTWPLFNGAIGMTYEQGGGGEAGRAVLTSEGDTLTLTERIAHHHTTALSTVETTAEHHEEVAKEFEAYYESSRENPPGEYQTYVVRRRGNEERVAALARHLKRQRIRFGYAEEIVSTNGYHYRDGRMESVQIHQGDLVIDAAQPKSRLLKVLFEPETTIVDSMTYDITAWGLPYAYGLEAYALPERVIPDTSGVPASQPVRTGASNEPYAYVTTWRSRADARFAAALLQNDVHLRFTTEGFSIGQRTFGPGTLLITRAGNEGRFDRFDDLVEQVARNHDQSVHGVQTGFTDEGPDFGSGTVGFVDSPAVAALSGEPLSVPRVGEVWHFFDQTIDYPLTLLPADDFNAAMLANVDVLILPDGDYAEWLTNERATALTDWVQEGGRLVALGSANDALAGQSAYHLSSLRSGGEADTTREASVDGYGTRPRAALANSTPGSIHRVRIDSTHPLAFGLDAPYFTLKRNAKAFSFQDSGWAVGVLEESAPVSGFMGHEAEQAVENSLLFGTQELGKGEVVYFVDNPLFRGFWYSGHVLFSNAVFLVGNG